jgi:hypothetical protein
MRIIFALAMLAISEFSTSSTKAFGYQYPYRDPHLATATSAVLGNDEATAKDESQILRLPGLPGRNHLPGLEGRGHLSLAFYRQNRPAPLLFILGGVGSTPFFGVGPYLARLFYQAGYHVVVLPSPMGWNFALSASHSGAPGYAPQDARELYDVMQKTLMVLRDRFAVTPKAIHFLGVSLGALEGAHLSVIEADEGRIGIAKYLLINPPVGLEYVIDKITDWGNLAKTFGAQKTHQLVSQAVAIVDGFTDEKPDDPAVIRQLAKQFSTFSTDELKYLIADALQGQLYELVYVTQAIHDQKLLAAAKGDRRQRLQEAKSFTLVDYNWKVALPIWRRQLGQPQADFHSLLQRSSLAVITDRLRRNPKVHIMHNLDDFLAERKSIDELKAELGDQMTLYPHGGHLGNLWYPENKKAILDFFRGDPKTAPVRAVAR